MIDNDFIAVCEKLNLNKDDILCCRKGTVLTEQRTAIICILYLDFSYNFVEIARVMNRTPANARWLFYGRFRFKDYISMVRDKVHE